MTRVSISDEDWQQIYLGKKNPGKFIHPIDGDPKITSPNVGETSFLARCKLRGSELIRTLKITTPTHNWFKARELAAVLLHIEPDQIELTIIRKKRNSGRSSTPR